MKVFLTIWILAVLIQEVIPSTLVRLPRHAEKNLSSVHTEYEAKYEQKGKHGNESFSSVSGKQEIVHDNCAENWNSFAEKCASLIKDLVASLANAVSSKPGDATNLQLHIKNTFRHFDNTHNCTCLNHTGKTLSDLNLSPLFKNISINTVGPSTKTDAENDSGAKHKKCGGESQPCGGNSGSDTEKDKNTTPESNGVGGDKNGFDQKQLKENGQLPDKSWDEHNDKLQTGNDAKSKIFDEKLAEEQKQLNRALADAEDLDVNPENDEGSSDQSTNNNRRQIKYPQNLMKPQKFSKNSGDSDFNPLADDLRHYSSNTKRPEGVRYPFLVTARPNSQLAKLFDSPAVALNPASLSGSSLDSDIPKSPECEPSNVLLSQENSPVSTSVPPYNSSDKSNVEPSSASYPLTSLNNENSSPNNNYLHPAAQVVTEPHPSIYNEEDPKKVFPSKNPGLDQTPISQPINPMNNGNNQSPAIISEEPFIKNYNSEPAVLIPAKSVNNKPYAQSPAVLPEDQQIYNRKSETEVPMNSVGSEPNPQIKQELPEKSVIDSQALNIVPIPAEQLESDHKLVPPIMQSENPISTKKSSGQPIVILPKPPLLAESSDPEAATLVKSVSTEPNTPSPVILPKEAVTNSHVSKPAFIPAEQVESGPDGISSPITRSSQEPIVILPEKPKTEDCTSDLSKTVLDNYKPNVDFPEPISAVPVESTQSDAFPELSLPKNIKSESRGLIPENSAGNNYNSESPSFIQNKNPIEEAAKQWLQFTTPKTYDSDKILDRGNTKPTSILNIPEEDAEVLKRFPSAIPIIDSNKNYAQSSEPESDAVTLNPSFIYKPSSTGSGSRISPGPVKNPLILAPEDILPIAADGKPFFEEQTTTECDQTTEDDLEHTISKIKPIPTVPEIASQQSGISIPIEKQLHDKSNQLTDPELQIPGHPAPAVPESTLPQKPFFEKQTTTECDQTTEDDLEHTISKIKPIPTVPEIASQQSGMSIPIEKQLHDKSNQLTDSELQIPGHPALAVPESTLPQKPFFEKQTTTECDQTTEDDLEHTISKIKPIPTVPEIASQQSGMSIPIEKQLHDKSNQLTDPELQIPGHLAPAAPESTLPQKPFFSAQNSDAEIVNSPMEKIQDPQQSIQEVMHTTPLPFYPIKTITVIPGVGQPAMVAERPRVYESQGKDFTVTEIPTASDIQGTSVTKDQQRQPSKVIPGSTPLNGKPVNTPVVTPEIATTTPVIIYPVKSLPILSQSPEQTNHESSHPVLANTGFSDGNQKPEIEAIPTSPIKPLQVVPEIMEQQSSNAYSPLQPTAITESSLESDSPNKQEHSVTYGPVRDSDNIQHPKAIVKPDKIPAQLTPPIDDHPQSAIDLNSVPSSTGNSETTPVISSEPRLETAVPPTLSKPAQPSVLIQNAEPYPHQEEKQNPLLIQPTTFQTTSEDPTPAQVNFPGLLTHTTSVPQDSDETMPVRPSTSPKTTSIYEHDDYDEEDCCSCESCTEEEITDPKQYKETACKNLEEARKELKAIFDKIKKKLKCGRKAPQTITSS